MDKPNSLEELVAQIKQRQEPVKPSKRRWKRRADARKSGYTPAAQASQKAFWRTVSGTWKHLKKTYASRAKKRGEESRWQITLEEWKALWEAAGVVSLGDGKGMVSVFQLRGKGKGDARVYRIEESQNWTLNNMVVMYRGTVKANGRLVEKAMVNEALS